MHKQAARRYVGCCTVHSDYLSPGFRFRVCDIDGASESRDKGTFLFLFWLRRCPFCDYLLSADRRYPAHGQLSAESRERVFGRSHRGKNITLSHVNRGRSEGCPPSEGSLGCLKGMKLSLCPLSQFYMTVQAQTWSSLPPEKPESKAADSALLPACLGEWTW